MASSASDHNFRKPQVAPTFLPLWKVVIIFLQTFHLIGHIHGAPKPMEAFSASAWTAAGEGQKVRELGGSRAAFDEVKGMGDMSPPPYSERMDSHPTSDPLEEHSSTAEDGNLKQDKRPEAKSQPEKKLESTQAGDMQKSKLLDSMTQSQKVLNEQDSHLLGLRLISPDINKVSETLRLDYRATLVRDMKLQGPGAKNWLKNLPPPHGADRYIKDEWDALKLGALEDYKMEQGGFYREKVLPILYYFFNRAKLLNSKLDKLFLKIRLMKDFEPSKHDLIVLEMDNVRRAGVPLPQDEIQLLQRIVEVGRDVSKLTETELNLLTKLSGKTVAQRRLEMLSALRAHIHQQKPSLFAFGGDTEAQRLQAALKALQSNAEREINWTKEQTQLVSKLQKMEKFDQLDKSLSKAQNTEIERLVEEETTVEQAEEYDQAIHRLATKQGSMADDSDDTRLFDMLHQRLEGARRGSTIGMGIKFSKDEKARISDLAEEYRLQMGKIRLHTNPKAIDISDLALLKYELPPDTRVQKALKVIESSAEKVENPTRAKILKKLEERSENPRLADGHLQNLAAQYDEHVKTLDARHKAQEVLGLHQDILNYDVKIRTWIKDNPQGFQAIDPSIVGEEEAATRTAYLVAMYHRMVDTMSPEEKVVEHLATKSKKGFALHANEETLAKSLSQKTLLNPGDRFLVATYDDRYGESLEKLAHNRLIALKKLGGELSEYNKIIEAKLRFKSYFALSEGEMRTVRHLAREELVFQETGLSEKSKRAVLVWLGKINGEKEDFRHSAKLFNQFTPEEMAQYGDLHGKKFDLLTKGKTSSAYDPHVVSFINLVQSAEQRLDFDMTAEDIKEAESLIQSQHNIRANEIAELEQNFQKKAAVLKAFAEHFKKENKLLTQPQDVELPADVKQFLDQDTFSTHPTLQPFP